MKSSNFFRDVRVIGKIFEFSPIIFEMSSCGWCALKTLKWVKNTWTFFAGPVIHQKLTNAMIFCKLMLVSTELSMMLRSGAYRCVGGKTKWTLLRMLLLVVWVVNPFMKKSNSMNIFEEVISKASSSRWRRYFKVESSTAKHFLKQFSLSCCVGGHDADIALWLGKRSYQS